MELAHLGPDYWLVKPPLYTAQQLRRLGNALGMSVEVAFPKPELCTNTCIQA